MQCFLVVTHDCTYSESLNIIIIIAVTIRGEVLASQGFFFIPIATSTAMQLGSR
jgi:hypothetical protein